MTGGFESAAVVVTKNMNLQLSSRKFLSAKNFKIFLHDAFWRFYFRKWAGDFSVEQAFLKFNFRNIIGFSKIISNEKQLYSTFNFFVCRFELS